MHSKWLVQFKFSDSYCSDRWKIRPAWPDNLNTLTCCQEYIVSMLLLTLVSTLLFPHPSVAVTIPSCCHSSFVHENDRSCNCDSGSHLYNISFPGRLHSIPVLLYSSTSSTRSKSLMIAVTEADRWKRLLPDRLREGGMIEFQRCLEIMLVLKIRCQLRHA